MKLQFLKVVGRVFHNTGAALLKARATRRVVVLGSSSRWAPADLSVRDGTYAYRSSVMYSGASPFSALYTWMSSLYCILCSTGSQCRFIAGLDRIFRLNDHVNPGMTVGTDTHTVRMAKFEYADDAALIDEDAGQATARVTSLAAGSISDAAMIISAKKSKVMHIHKTTRTIATTEADVAKLNLVHL